MTSRKPTVLMHQQLLMTLQEVSHTAYFTWVEQNLVHGKHMSSFPWADLKGLYLTHER